MVPEGAQDLPMRVQSASKLIQWLLAGRLPMGSWIEGFSRHWSIIEAALSSLLGEHLQRELHQSQQESNSKQKSVFCNPILEVTSHDFCCILVVRRRSREPALAQGEGTAQEVGTNGGHLINLPITKISCNISIWYHT